MNTNGIKAVQGITEIYDSTKAKDFQKSSDYPIAWEVLFVNNDTGKEFAKNIKNAFDRLPKERGVIMDFQGEPNDVARCLECAFSSKDALRKVLNEAFDGIAFYHEEEKRIVPKINMLNDAGKILSQKMAVSM